MASDVPDIIANGFAAYGKTGSTDAINVWFKGSPMESDLNTRMTTASNLTKFEGAYGKFVGWELVKAYTLTASTKVIFVVVKYEKGPLWVAFNCYKNGDSWNIPTIGMDTNPTKILPASAF